MITIPLVNLDYTHYCKIIFANLIILLVSSISVAYFTLFHPLILTICTITPGMFVFRLHACKLHTNVMRKVVWLLMLFAIR